MTTREKLTKYFNKISGVATEAIVTLDGMAKGQLSDAINWTITEAKRAHQQDKKIMFVGNGGSAAIASHMATDFTKNGNLRAVAFNDSSTLTCLSNDLGYENVFSKQIEMYGQEGDLLIAISSSGQSPNIIAAVNSARNKKIKILTLSGFSPENVLRTLGDVNIYVPENEYGFVEISHLAICHAVLDFAMGWDN